MANKKLYIGSLPYDTTEEQLKELFSQAGTVDSATIIMDKFSGRSKGFGFVEMANEEEAQKAIESLNGHQVGDKSIIVNEARPMRERGSGGFGGGGGGYRGGGGGGGRGGSGGGRFNRGGFKGGY